MNPDDKVRYSSVFLRGMKNEILKQALAMLEGTVLEVKGTKAQVDFGCGTHRATSVVPLKRLEKV